MLQISNKYCCDTIEGRARPLVIQMTAEETIRSHIGPLLSAVDVFRIAIKASVPSNEVMLSGRKKWNTDESLTLSERQVLMKGMLSCVDDWDAFVMRLSSGNLKVPYQRSHSRHSRSLDEGIVNFATEHGVNAWMMGTDLESTPAGPPDVPDGDSEVSVQVTELRAMHCYHNRREYIEELATISQIHAFHRIPTCDIIGRLARIQESLPPADIEFSNYPSHFCGGCWRDVVSCAEETKAFIESRLPFHFIESERQQRHVVNFESDALSDVDSLEL